MIAVLRWIALPLLCGATLASLMLLDVWPAVMGLTLIAALLLGTKKGTPDTSDAVTARRSPEIAFHAAEVLFQRHGAEHWADRSADPLWQEALADATALQQAGLLRAATAEEWGSDDA